MYFNILIQQKHAVQTYLVLVYYKKVVIFVHTRIPLLSTALLNKDTILHHGA